MSTHQSARLETWGGLECTANRVHGSLHSQLTANGHLSRIEDDLDAFASLGLTSLRYPVLWEHIENSQGTLDFADADRAMRRLERGWVKPIVGLLHHGSGPRFTSLSDPEFPARLGSFAAAVAQRYPWVTDYTPVNEPLTTARFSGLYGHWYPHTRDDVGFVRMLLHEVRGIGVAMRAIREVNPAARLVQTEDLGRADGTPPLTDQVRFENERRWLSFDLLCGKVGSTHPLHGYLTQIGGATVDELKWFVDNPCTPDIIGINHYPRSNRWLDHRTALFDPSTDGGDHSSPYADVAASDLAFGSPFGFSTLITETWLRYDLPIALTEVHVPGANTERMHWWTHAVEEASEARSRGIDVRAVTTWSLLGSYDWDTLCTSPPGPVSYEPGAFDVSDGTRAETPLADTIRLSSRLAEIAAHQPKGARAVGFDSSVAAS